MKERNSKRDTVSEEERKETLEQFIAWLDTPMLILGFVWLILLIVELVSGLTPAQEILTTIIWACFVAEFAVQLTLAPHKGSYLKRNWLTVISLIVPAFRIFRITKFFRLLRVTSTVRGLRLVKVIGSLNRAINGLRENLGRYRAGYVLVMSLSVTFVGAAGMFAFESNLPNGQGLESYGDALWWTAMIMTTLGSQYWPKTVAGRLLGFLLSLYAFGVFGYVTGALASFFVGREKETQKVADTLSLDDIRHEIRSMRADLEKISNVRQRSCRVEQSPSDDNHPT
jgi:voltage-gated potassium channel